MLGAINELTSKHGGFDGPHQSKIQAARTQEGETHGEEDQEEDGEEDWRRRSRRQSRQEGQEGGQAQSRRQEESGARQEAGAKGRRQAGDATSARAETAGTGTILFRAYPAAAGRSATAPANATAGTGLHAAEACRGRADRAAAPAGTAGTQAGTSTDDPWQLAHASKAGGITRADAAKAAGNNLGRIGLERDLNR
jgi:hypothetical protein